MKNKAEIVLRLSSNMVGDDETNISHKLFLNNRQITNLRKAFANYLSFDLEIFVKPLQIIYQLILIYRKLKYLI